MPLLCEFGWHDPEPIPRWNNGYYFSICRRCGCDLIRTAFDRWHVPRGYRVVWQAQPPENVADSELVGAAATDQSEATQEAEFSRPTGGDELPISEVLRDLQQGEAERAASDPDEILEAEATTSERPVAPDQPRVDYVQMPLATVLKRSRIGDFMDSPDLPLIPEDDPAGTSRQHREGAASRMRRRIGEYSGRIFARRTAAPVGSPDLEESGTIGAVIEGRRTAEERGGIQLGVIASVAASILLLGALIVAVRQGTPSPTVNLAEEQVSAPQPSSGVTAYVTASVLNCRSAPAVQAQAVDRLVRGDAVRLIAPDGNWVSLSHEGRQCWALLRYFSLSRPG